MTEARSQATLPGDELFVIACPACRGELSAFASAAGRTACCPLCTATFVMPAPRRGNVGHEPADVPTALVVEPRRGTDEVGRRRRGRRTLIFLLAGAAVLVGVVFLLASWARR